MISQCPVCKKVKRFDKWIELPAEVEVLSKECIKEVHCPDHDDKVDGNEG